MKKSFFYILFAGLFLWSCKKNDTKLPVDSLACKPLTETNNLAGNSIAWEYIYGSDGNISLMKSYSDEPYHILQDSIIVTRNVIERYSRARYSTGFNKLVSVYDADIFTGRPSKCTFTLNHSDPTPEYIEIYSFTYDSKGRLVQVKQHTPKVTNDAEFTLIITYSDNDNVTLLRYETLFDSKLEVIDIPATGYDDRNNVFAAIKYRCFIMPVSWDNYDPEPIFNALSKNNLTGYKYGSRTTTIQSEYNEQGFPVIKDNTNITSQASAKFRQTYTYACK